MQGLLTRNNDTLGVCMSYILLSGKIGIRY